LFTVKSSHLVGEDSHSRLVVGLLRVTAGLPGDGRLATPTAASQ